MIWPDFLCMGFQKSGTTTLYEILKQHKDIELCRDVKEPMYYRVLGLRSIGGKKYYSKRYFGHIKNADEKLVGEINAGLTFTGCAEKICMDFPESTKLIFMMRNPVDRAYSAYKYFLARGFLPISVYDYDKKHGHAKGFDRYCHYVLGNKKRRSLIMKNRLEYLVFSQSNYATCINEFTGHFPCENIKLVFFEEFIKDQKAVGMEICDFIGAKRDDTIDYTVRANEGNEKATSGINAKYIQLVKGVNYIFYEFLGMQYWAPKIYARFREYYLSVREKCMVADEDKEKLLPETRKYLEKYFNKEVRLIERMAGRDLKDIWF